MADINTPISLDEESISINRSRLLSLTGSTFDISIGSSLTLLLSQGTWSQTLEVLVGAGGVFEVSGAKLIGLEDGALQIQALGRSSAGTPVSSAATTTQVDLLLSRLFINEVVAHTGEMLVDVSGTSQDVHQGAEVALTFTDTQGNTLDATATVQADGSWSLADMDLTGLVAGTITVDATAVDNNGRNVVAVASDAEVSDVAPDQDVAVDMQYMVTTGNRLTVGADLTNVEDGRVVDVVLADGAGHSRTYEATVSNGAINLAALSTSEFTTPNLHITVRAKNSAGLIGSAEADALLVLAAPPKTKAATLTLGALQIDDQQQVSVTGTTTKVVQGTAVQIVLTDSHGNSLSTQGSVDANGVLNVQNISTVGLDEGTVSVQVYLNAAGKPMCVAQSFELVRNHAPEGTDGTVSATEDVLYAISASDFGFTDLDSHSMTGVKITALPANGELKLNGAAVTLDQVISKADIDAGHLTFKAASNANGSNYASLQFKVQDSGSSHNEDTTANTLTFNVAAVNDAPTGSVTIAGTTGSGQTLTVSNNLADVDGMGTISYQWFANGTAITGATGASYQLTLAEVGKTITVKASYIDGANNATVVSSTATTPVLDFTPPDAPIVAYGAGVSDGATAAEATAGTGVVTVTAGTGLSTEVIFTNGTHTVSKTVIGNGATPVAVTLTTDDLNALGNGTISVSAKTTSSANIVGAPANTSFMLDTAGPDIPGLALGVGVANGATTTEATSTTGVVMVNAENGSTVAVTFTDSLGHSVTKIVTGTGVVQAVSLDASDLGTGMSQLVDGTITVSAVATDSAGNPSAASTSSFMLDTAAPSIPLLALGTGVANGATSAEATAGTGVISVNAENGSAVVVTFTDHLGHSVTKNVTGTGAAQTITLDVADLGTGASKLADGTITVSAVATDTAGNPSAAGTSSFTLDTTAPVAVADTSSANENNLIQVGSVKTNDTALDGTEQFTLVGTNAGAYGTLVLTSLGTYTYTYNSGIIHGITTDVVDTFTYQVTDAAGNTSTATLAITVTPVNTAPVNTVPVATQTLDEDNTKVIAGLSIADVDANGGIETVTLSVAHGTLTVLAGSGVTLSANGTASVTLSGTVTDINALLNTSSAVTYAPTANYNGTDTLTMTTHDGGNTGAGGAKSDTDTVAITIAAVNDAPTLTVTSANPTFTEGGGSSQGVAVNLFSAATSAAGPTNESGQSLTQLTVTVSGLADGANEVLRVNGTFVALTHGTSGTNANGVGYSVSVTGSTATVTITPPALNQTTAMMDSLITNLAYENTNVDNPTAGTRVITLTGITDNGGTANGGQDTATFNYTSTVNVVAVNDAPTGSVTLSGTVKQGQTLTASNTLADADGMGTVSYSWFADGTAISGATASTYTLTANEVGKVITAKASYTDGGNNATVVTSTASAAVLSSGVAGDTVINLGAGNGLLIAPVQVEGKWYYFWDRSGDGAANAADQSIMTTWASTFNHDINGNVNPAGAYIDDTYRYGTVNGVFLALPSLNGNQPYVVFNYNAGTAATGGGTANNSSYDGLLAVWDNYNGTGVSTNVGATALTGWATTGAQYWAATQTGGKQTSLVMSSGYEAEYTLATLSSYNMYTALEVVKTNAAPVLDAAQSPVLATITTTATAPTNGNTTAGVLVSSLVAGVSDADSGATNGIAITAAASGTVYYSTNGGTTWSSIASTSLTNTNALLLAADADTRVYFQPTTPTAGTTSNALTFRAWDMTQHITEGVLADTTANGGKAEFSTATDTVALTVATPAAMSSVVLSGATGIQNNTLNVGDVVTASVTYASAVTVSGAPTLSMVIGSTTVQATYDAANSTATVLKFNYTVLPTQTDANGISIPTNAISLNGGSIIGGNGVTAVVTNTLVADNASYMVDTSNPTATLTSTGTLGTTQSAVVQSSEVGTAYLVDSTASVTSEAQILALQDAQFNSVSIATAATATNLALTGLNAGNYKLYTADKAGNLSVVTGNSVDVVPSIDAVNLSAVANGVGGFAINGEQTNAYSGYSVSNAGDVNGDGYSDVIIGAYNISTQTGKSYVVFGSSNTATTINLTSLTAGTSTQGFVINGQSTGDYSGVSVSSAGDFNGDGLADLLIGAKGGSMGATQSGSTYVIYGTTSTAAIYLSAYSSGVNTGGFVISGQVASDFSGYSVSSAGDVNGDGLVDLIIGAYAANANGALSGKSYVVFGTTSNAAINLSAIAAGAGGFVINGQVASDQSGYSVSSAGDVNGDGLADLMVGAIYADPVGGTDAGKSYVVFGTTNTAAINLSALTSGSSTQGFVINGQAASDQSGIYVSNAGDVNGDGLADLIVGANLADPTSGTNAGKSYVVFGTTSGAVINLSAVAAGTGGFVINGQSANDASGVRVSSAGDINGDGLTDLIVGANTANATGVNSGKTYVVFGTTSNAAINLSAVANGAGGFVINGQTAADQSGWSVSAAGDLNGDGFADLIVGAYGATSNTGKTYVIYGGTQYASGNVDFVGSTGADTQTGTSAAETFMAGDGNDTLTGNGGADVMNGGKGNDTFVLNASNITALQNKFGAGGNTTQLARIDGGTGIDTLQLAQGAGNLDLTQISNVDAVAGDSTSRISSIERIDLATDTAANTLTLTAKDVNDMAGFNQFNNGNGWVGLGTTVQRHQLVVDGAAGDSVVSSGSWASAGTVTNSGKTYMVYNSTTSATQLLVNTAVVVSGMSVQLPAVNLATVAAGTGGFVINGASGGDSIGWSVSNAGDVNGDGYADVILGAPFANMGSTYTQGKSYVVFGASSQSTVELSNLGTQGFVIIGEGTGIGNSVAAAGDLNGDGLADLVTGTSSSGKTYVVYGTTSTAAIYIAGLTSGSSTQGFLINEENGSFWTGYSVSSAGDVNGDGWADMLIGSRSTSTGSIGRAYVVFGSSSAAPVNLSAVAAGTGGFAILGQPNDQAGTAVSSAGDVNGDGLADVLVGANMASSTAGKSYVVYGTTSTAVVRLSAVANTSVGGFVINAEGAGDGNGWAVANAGDVNGDGYADLIVGAPWNAANGTDTGRSYVVFGGANLGAINLSTITNGTGGFVINGGITGGHSGASVSTAGDINGDGLADVLVSVPDTGVGKTYVVLGKTGNTAINLSAVGNGFGGFVINGQAVGDVSGEAVSNAGDLNGDGYADWIVSARQADPTSGVNAGKSYIVYGGLQYTSGVVDFAGSTGADTQTGTSASETFMAGDGADTLIGNGGADVMNGGKGNDTFVLNASNITALQNKFGAGGNTTQLARIDGGTGIDTLQLAQGAGNLDLTQISNVDAGAGDSTSRINSIERIDLATDTAANTLTLTAKDVNDMAGMNLFNNGNGWAGLGATVQRHQLVVDGTSADTLVSLGTWANAGTVSNSGKTYTVYNSTTSATQLLVATSVGVAVQAPSVNLSAVASGQDGFVINGNAASMASGYTVSGAGDVNGDGLSDVIVGSKFGLTGYVVFGKTGQTAVNLSALATDGFVLGGYSNSGTGSVVSAAGDVNGDGLADVIVSDPKISGSSYSNSGRSYIVYGKANNAFVSLDSSDTTQVFSVGGESSGDSSGASLSAAGDVNGDGFADLIIGTNPSSLTGRSYVLFGSSSNIWLDLPNLSANSRGFFINGVNGDAALAGRSVSGAGDVNGDGLADLIVGAPGSGTGPSSSYVVFGKTDLGAIELSSINAGVGGFAIQGVAGDLTGYAVSNAGDVNGDGLADLFVSAPARTNGSSAIVGGGYVVFGKTGTGAISLSNLGSNGFLVNGENDGRAGWTVSNAGDIDGDGLSDLIIGTNMAAGTNASAADKSYVVFGKASSSTINLSTIAAGIGGFVINGQSGDKSDVVSAAGDVNGDGYADLIVGAQGVASSAGQSYVIFGGSQFASATSVVDFLGSANADTQTGTSASETFMAGDGADTLIGNGGADVMNGGKGNDTFVLNASNVTALSSSFGAGGNTTQLARIDGGTGFDTIQVSASGVNLDLTQVSNVGAGSPDGTSRINSVERIDLGSDAVANTLTIAAKDVNDMAGFNTIHLGGSTATNADGRVWTNVVGTALSDTTQYHQVVVDGSSSDIVNLKSGLGTWMNVGTVNNGSSDYVVWQNASTASQVVIKSGVIINGNVAPIVFDLNRDGVLSYSQVTMDVNGDGAVDVTKWAGAQDGVLVWDKYMDGLVHDNSQYAFAQYATTYANGKAPTDLSGLAEAFDTNHDGVFNAADTKFVQFSVWQDINQNGVSDAGEVRGLLDWGITSVNLSSDNIVRTPTAGVTEAGRTTATATDGSSVLVSDAAFEYHAAAPANAAAGTATIKLYLSDVLQAPANDSALLKGSESGSTIVAQGCVASSYAGTNPVDQLLIDQHMLQHAV